MRPINGIQPPLRLEPLNGGAAAKSGKVDFQSGIDEFAKVLTNEVNDVNSMQIDANDMVHF